MYRIRIATPDDLPSIKLMLREFAEYLNAIDDPEPITEEQISRIENFAFGPRQVCTILLAERENDVAAYLSYFWGLSMEGIALALFIGDLYVRERERGKGCGRLLMQEAHTIAQVGGANQVVWTVWRKNLPAQKFYDHIGARRYNEEILMNWSIDDS